MKNKISIIIDFDSTLVTIECLDTLAGITLEKAPKRKEILEEIKNITNLGMEGKISFPESLNKRLLLFQTRKEDIKKLIGFIRKNITPSVKNNKEFFEKYADSIYIISGGFKEYIIPIIKPFGIKESHVFANTFAFDTNGVVIGFDKNNLLSLDGGKVKQIEKLNLQGTVYIVGDGYTDYQIKEKGHAKKFFAYTENVKRESVVSKADFVSASFDEVLFRLKLPRSQSYPKTMMKVLLLDNIHPYARKLLEKEGYSVKLFTHPLNSDTLGDAIKDISILGVREKVIPSIALAHANKLLTIGVFDTEKDHIDLKAASRKGIAVFDASTLNMKNTEKKQKKIVEFVCKKIISFINTGNTTLSVNLPEVLLPGFVNAHRFIHIHHNKPGIMAQLNNIFAKNKINIDEQYLKTNDEVGYVITDVNKDYSQGVIKELRSIPGTIRVRVLY